LNGGTKAADDLGYLFHLFTPCLIYDEQ
jgi:hypothetical protein